MEEQTKTIDTQAENIKYEKEITIKKKKIYILIILLFSIVAINAIYLLISGFQVITGTQKYVWVMYQGFVTLMQFIGIHMAIKLRGLDIIER